MDSDVQYAYERLGQANVDLVNSLILRLHAMEYSLGYTSSSPKFVPIVSYVLPYNAVAPDEPDRNEVTCEGEWSNG